MKALVACIWLCAAAASAQNTNRVTLAWDAHPDPAVTGFRLYQGTDSRSYTLSNAVAQPATTLTLTNLAAGTKYYFAVTAFTPDAESGFSSEVSYTTPLNPPVGLRVSAILQAASSITGPWEEIWRFDQQQLATTESKFFRAVMEIRPNE